jgi:uncharacterized membrane protein SpoIIM required for sporulation
MLETLIFPKEGERKPWKLFIIGLVYSILSFFLVNLIFSKDVVLSRYSGLLVVMFAVLFSIIFFYYSLRLDEKENIREKNEEKALKDDWKILIMFLWLFLGLTIGFSLCQIVFPHVVNFNAQLETYCVINKPLQYSDCLDSYKLTDAINTIDAVPRGSFLPILVNNIYVLIFILIFSLIFGAGAIFIITWNASIISTVISLSVTNLKGIPFSLFRFLVHGLPEMAAYFLVAMAGGMASIALSSFFRKKISSEKLLKIIRRSSYLIILSILVLVIAALIEVYISTKI